MAPFSFSTLFFLPLNALACDWAPAHDRPRRPVLASWSLQANVLARTLPDRTLGDRPMQPALLHSRSERVYISQNASFTGIAVKNI